MYYYFLKRKKRVLKNSSEFPTISKPVQFPSDSNIPLSLWCILSFIFFFFISNVWYILCFFEFIQLVSHYSCHSATDGQLGCFLLFTPAVLQRSSSISVQL